MTMMKALSIMRCRYEIAQHGLPPSPHFDLKTKPAMRWALTITLAALLVAIFFQTAALADDDTDDLLMKFFIYQSVRNGLAEGVAGYLNQKNERASWDSNIADLEKKLQECGDCANRAELQKQLDYWKNTKSLFNSISCSVIETIGKGDPKWTNGVNTLLQLPCAHEAGHMMSDSEELQALRKEGTPEKCVEYYAQYQRCSREAGFDPDAIIGDETGATCRDPYQLYRYCKAGDQAAFAKEMRTQMLRKAGFIVPEVITHGHSINVYYGTVPKGFVPPVPAPALLRDKTTIITEHTTSPGELSEIRIDSFAADRIIDEATRGHALDFERSPEYKVFKDEVDKIGNQMLIGTTKLFVHNKLVIRCKYTQPKNTELDFAYWLGTEPTAANPEKLSAALPHNPLLFIGPARSNCPATIQEAGKAWSRSGGPIFTGEAEGKIWSR